jgi:phytoene dehydrogenase-like protein
MGYDVIICGAGEGGLFTGAILAKNGLKPLVLEKKSVVGGRAMSIEYQPGYIVDYGIHSIRYGNKGIIPTIFQKDLGMKLNLLDYKSGKLFRNDAWYEIPTSLNGFMTTPLLTDEERKTFLPLFMDIIRLKAEEYFEMSIQNYFKEKIQSENLWKLIKLIAAGLMVTPEIERASMGEFVDGLKQVITAGKGASYPQGGWNEIFNKLIERIFETGKILTDTGVRKILISNKHVEAVLLDDGTKISCNSIVVALSAQQIFSILPESEFNPAFISYCKNITSSSGIALDIGLKERISEDSGLIAVDNPMTLACFTSNVDPSTAPENEQLFTILQPMSQKIVENPQQSNKKVEQIEKLMYHMYPKMKNRVKWKRILKIPVIDGAINYIGQTRDKRPKIKSDSIKGLYFAGDTYNGPGLGGDIAPSSARLCAHTLLADLQVTL